MYATVYEIGPVSTPMMTWSAELLFGALLTGIGYQIKKLRFGARIQQVIAILVGVVWTTISGVLLTIATVNNLVVFRAYATGGGEVLEGKVRVLREQPVSGHVPDARPDLVTVAGRELEVDYSRRMEPGYHLTIAHGGVLSDGSCVRLVVCNGYIVRVDVAMTATDKAPRDSRAELCPECSPAGRKERCARP